MRAALRIVPIIILFAAGCKPVDQAPPAEEVEAGNGRVVAGQQGPVQVPGESLTTMTFADRMARHQAPGPGDGPKPVSVVTLDSLAMAKIVGEYALTYQKETIPLTVSQSGERLVMTSQAMGLVRDTVLAISPTSFISPNRGIQFDFTVFETSVAMGVTVALAPGFTISGKRK